MEHFKLTSRCAPSLCGGKMCGKTLKVSSKICILQLVLEDERDEMTYGMRNVVEIQVLR